MRPLKTAAILAFCAGLLFSTSSCLVVVKKDNGRHKGWFKNTNNPHHPHSTNPGNGNSGGKGKKNKHK
ncbi:MAG: hypothetical protein H0V01_12045 [Bacteroidetes bacterium]|nr:hypothetical protein [Bacteroidota bacterium]HET6245186.1 hypothetical protein [Bacteroidia bacterium]